MQDQGSGALRCTHRADRRCFERQWKLREQSRRTRGVPRLNVLAVTVLTSIDETILESELRVTTPMKSFVSRLARMAADAGCDGVIASPHEIAAVRAAVSDPNFLIVTPGVRPVGAERGDQARVMTPADAIRCGANYLVIGRPIVSANDPAAAAQQIVDEITSVEAATYPDLFIRCDASWLGRYLGRSPRNELAVTHVS